MDFKACCFELKVLNEYKYFMPWVLYAFGNIFKIGAVLSFIFQLFFLLILSNCLPFCTKECLDHEPFLESRYRTRRTLFNASLRFDFSLTTHEAFVFWEEKLAKNIILYIR